MPEFDNMYQFCCLIFSQNVEFFYNETNTRYDGFRIINTTNTLYFDFEFTGHDVEIINLIRKDISELFMNDNLLKD